MGSGVMDKDLCFKHKGWRYNPRCPRKWES